MCIHLQPAEAYIKSKGIPEFWRGQPWTDNCREWIYFDCFFNPAELKAKLKLDECVQVHDYFDIKAGSERGLVCDTCKDGVMGIHPDSGYGASKPVID
jgi:hypothetical protein